MSNFGVIEVVPVVDNTLMESPKEDLELKATVGLKSANQLLSVANSGIRPFAELSPELVQCRCRGVLSPSLDYSSKRADSHEGANINPSGPSVLANDGKEEG